MHIELTPDKFLLIIPLKIIALEVPNSESQLSVFNKTLKEDIYCFKVP